MRKKQDLAARSLAIDFSFAGKKAKAIRNH